MREKIKEILKPLIPRAILTERKKKWENGLRIVADNLIIEEWKKNGCPIPPPHLIKQITIKDYQKKYKYATLIETGTYLGDMIEAQKDAFKKIISIELSNDLFLQAKSRFINDKNVFLVQGDSGKVLPDILKGIFEPVIFWLDGHYSAGVTAMGEKECPIFEELDAIFGSKHFKHVILIDDARLFIGQNDYPTIENLTEYIFNKNKQYKIEVKDDIIRCTI